MNEVGLEEWSPFLVGIQNERRDVKSRLDKLQDVSRFLRLSWSMDDRDKLKQAPSSFHLHLRQDSRANELCLDEAWCGSTFNEPGCTMLRGCLECLLRLHGQIRGARSYFTTCGE